MWGTSWGTGAMIVGFLGALVAMSFAFGGGGVIVAIPLAVIGVALIAAIDFRRRRQQARDIHGLRDQAKAEGVEFTERDRETLVSE